jgi:hypothetical protein
MVAAMLPSSRVESDRSMDRRRADRGTCARDRRPCVRPWSQATSSSVWSCALARSWQCRGAGAASRAVAVADHRRTTVHHQQTSERCGCTTRRRAIRSDAGSPGSTRYREPAPDRFPGACCKATRWPTRGARTCPVNHTSTGTSFARWTCPAGRCSGSYPLGTYDTFFDQGSVTAVEARDGWVDVTTDFLILD